ncbi:MAG: hypothetical protein WD048_06740 [Chitinophagales bacterium]
MRNPFEIGAIKTYRHKVSKNDTARFESGEVHAVYATFALARDAEWACRLFVLEMKEEHEEGIGSALSIKHHAPAAVGAELVFTAKLESVENNKVLCSFKVAHNQRLIAEGTQEQRILSKEKLKTIFKSI